ncbi:MAG: peroxiredoxin [Candidatus Methanomethylophilaceae archaeon]|jgi:peroxiredoxin (alkyl hydroperoxide reductase subunit C)
MENEEPYHYCYCDEAEVSERIPLIGEDAPAFKANTTQGEINFPEDFKGKWVILFSHPADFTPVCSTEFMTFAAMADEFKALNTQLVGISIDSIHSHIAWLRSICQMEWGPHKKGVEIAFPLIDDVSMSVANKYGMVHDKSSTSAVRATFIIDPVGKIRTILYYPASTGRNMEEIKRVVIALQKADKDKCATPANWKPGDDVIIPPPGSCGAAKDRVADKSEDKYCYDWFLCFRKEKKQ